MKKSVRIIFEIFYFINYDKYNSYSPFHPRTTLSFYLIIFNNNILLQVPFSSPIFNLTSKFEYFVNTRMFIRIFSIILECFIVDLTLVSVPFISILLHPCNPFPFRSNLLSLHVYYRFPILDFVKKTSLNDR